ncbi:Patellin-3 [Dactylella cylindrospora]|nr:Patellin-3 [Dactylella cylindrospora]
MSEITKAPEAPTVTEPVITEKVEAPAPQASETPEVPSAKEEAPAKEETATKEPEDPKPAPVATTETTVAEAAPTAAPTTEPAPAPVAQTAAETKAPEPVGAETVAGKPAGAEPVAEPTKKSIPLSNEQWGTISPSLEALYKKLPELLELAGYNEVFGVTLVYNEEAPEPAFTTLLILQKFLRANSDNLDKAVDQLVKTLKWRKEFKPLEALAGEHDRSRFDGLGYVQVNTVRGEILTWNIYGAVTDYKKTFGEVETFLKWRVALMEAAISKLDLPNATKPIPDLGKGADPYQLIQIHDYLNVSFFRMDPYAKTASKSTIELFRDYYPEMLSRKFFVNVPVVMGWVFSAMKLVLPKATIDKFQVLSYGEKLHEELGPQIPEAYGGKDLKDLKELGDPVRLTAVEAAPTTTPATAPAATTEAA